ncbi:hypothetical protein ENSA5_36620 [Enhygromyxa salina]|uniref:Uncharacterized protein n=1 Tax=Enhygromyxa salina TaxID=215803 RepID=A0A2S9XUP2_9BACT|nr:hypothetical protein [Enhygromyxa salina]PRP96586.1 hypothetical protein ENSA5_36620 [Enhygromyxa salina]
MNAFSTKRIRTALLTLAGVAGLAAVVATTTTEAEAGPGQDNHYVVQAGGFNDVMFGDTLTIHRTGDGQMAFVSVDGHEFLQTPDLVSHTSDNANSQQTYAGTTVTELPGGGTRVDIDHGDGSSTTVVHDPNGGPNGGSRTTVGHTGSDGSTTTTTTTTDGSDGSSTTTTSRS